MPNNAVASPDGVVLAAVVIALEGEIDLSTVDTLEAEIEAALVDSPKEVVLDLSRLTFMDSTGLSCMLTAHHRLADTGGLLVLQGPPSFVLKLLDATGLRQHFTIAA